MEFLKTVNISNIEDLKKYCEIRYDCLNIVDKIEQYNILDNVLNYFDELQYNCDDIYEFFIDEIDDFLDLVDQLHEYGYLSDEETADILEEEKEG